MTDLLLLLSLLLLFLPLLPPTHGLGSPATIAISHATGTVCGIRASATPRTIHCARGSLSLPLFPNTSFLSVSGGRDFFCGLRAGGTALFCWTPAAAAFTNTTTDPPRKRLYFGPSSLSSLTVGEDHVCAAQASGGLQWWRGGGRFPTTVDGNYTSLTSGNGFTCGIDSNTNMVRCWGNGQQMERDFAGNPMSTIVAGDSHACGITTAGTLICNGRNDSGQLGPPPSSAPFEFSGLALGFSHSCAIRKSNGTVVCWGGSGGGGSYSPATSVSMELIVAGGNLTCGLTTQNFSVVCWGLEKSPPSPVALPLPPILPGFCTDGGGCSCGPFPDSERLCFGSGVICKPCDSVYQVLPPPPPPPATTPRPSPPSTPNTSKRESKGFLAFAIVGSVGGFAGVCTVVYCLWTGVCRQKKVHNSVQPTIAGATNFPPGPSAVTTPFGSPSKSMRSMSRSSIFRRQGSRVMRRQRSGPSSSSMRERAEEFTFKELADATKNFSLDTKIGAGSFGTVYKGKLADGREVAIKRSETGPTRANKFQEKESAFQSELAFLSRLHHKHLVGLVGFCEEREERLLVYEFMKNGALYDHLHGGGGALNSWKMRIKVLLDASRGIEYLHSYAVPPIIHRDIKSSNILLDGNWTARVSDFGLSLNGPESDGGHLSMKAAGTVGYMDPEYYGLHHLTTKSDVYGLGVVMLETLTGRRAVFKEGDESPMSVVDYAVPRIMEGEVVKVLDTRVAPLGPREAEAVELVAYTARHCVKLEGKDRPTMSDVVANLENALSLFDDPSNGSISSGSVSLTSYD